MKEEVEYNLPEVLFDFVLPAGRRFWPVREVPRLTALAVYPRTQGEVVTRLLKQAREDAEPVEMDAEDWATLERLWAPLDPIQFPLGEDEWGKYEEALNAAKDHPDWCVIPVYRDNSMMRELCRVSVERDHEQALKAAMESGQVETLNPLTYTPNAGGGVWLGDEPRKNQLITAKQIARFAATLGIRETVATAKIDRLEKPMETKERETLLKMLLGMAIRGYGYDLSKQRSDVPGEIARDLEALGIAVTDETVKNRLRDAVKILDFTNPPPRKPNSGKP